MNINVNNGVGADSWAIKVGKRLFSSRAVPLASVAKSGVISLKKAGSSGLPMSMTRAWPKRRPF
jgi:hypothetical protein